MSATTSAATTIPNTSPLAHRVHDDPAPIRRDQTLELDVVAGGDPVRLAHILATMVNNSPMALVAVTVGEQSAYPVPAMVITRREPMRFTLRMRDVNRRLDGLVVEEIVSIVSTMCTIVDRRRHP